jgi:ribosomal protein L28
MSRVCQICGKKYQKGNLVPRGIGNRVTRRSITQFKPNLRVKRMEIDGKKQKVILCASCLKRLKKDEKEKAAVLIENSKK